MSNVRGSAAVLVLMKGEESQSEVLLIERSATVNTHKSQVAFPGGGVEPMDQNDPIRTALRECFEEVGISPQHVKVIKTLPQLPTLTSGFFVVPVLGALKPVNPNEVITLTLDPNEVAHSEWVSVQSLLGTKRVENGFPVFDWVGKDHKTRKVWGLTAIIFELIFNSDTKSL